MIIAGAKILQVATNPLAVAAIGLVATFGAWNAGQWVGHARGVADQEAKQLAANVAASNEIRERVKDALSEIGADATDDDIDDILRRLAGD